MAQPDQEKDPKPVRNSHQMTADLIEAAELPHYLRTLGQQLKRRSRLRLRSRTRRERPRGFNLIRRDRLRRLLLSARAPAALIAGQFQGEGFSDAAPGDIMDLLAQVGENV
eukprot:g18316.t1